MDDTYPGAFPKPSVSFLLIHGNVDTGQRVIDDGIFQYIGGVLRALFGNLVYRYVGDVHTLLFWLSVGYSQQKVFNKSDLISGNGMTGSCAQYREWSLLHNVTVARSRCGYGYW